MSQYGTDSVLDRPYTVTYRDNNGGFRLKCLLVKTDWLEMRGQVAAYHLSVFCTGGFHLDLYKAVLGIYIVEHLLSGFPYSLIYVSGAFWETFRRKS